MTDLFAFFRKIASDLWSGEVRVSSSEGLATLGFERGKLIYAHRPMDRAIERLQRLPWCQLPPPESLSALTRWEQLVQVLLHDNLKNSDALVKHLRTDRLEIFFRLFFWTNVELEPQSYELRLELSPHMNFYSPREIEKLLAEAEERVREWPQIQERIGSGRRIFVSRVKGIISEYIEPDRDAIDSAISDFEKLTTGGSHSKKAEKFSSEQKAILELCDGRHSVQDIVKASADGEYLTLRRMLDLWEQGYISPREEDFIEPRLTKRKSSTSNNRLGFVGLQCMVVLILVGVAALRPKPRLIAPPQAMEQALEIYRLKFGRYPVTLDELRSAKIISSRDWQAFDYQLLNLQDYQLRPHLPPVVK